MWSNAPLGSASELGACASQERAWWFGAARGGLVIPGGRGQATWRSANASGLELAASSVADFKAVDHPGAIHCNHECT